MDQEKTLSPGIMEIPTSQITTPHPTGKLIGSSQNKWDANQLINHAGLYTVSR